jgi:hypothetical protein
MKNAERRCQNFMMRNLQSICGTGGLAMSDIETLSRLSRDKQELFKEVLKGYRQGVIDTGKIIEDIVLNTKNLYDVKIKQVDDLLSKQKG